MEKISTFNSENQQEIHHKQNENRQYVFLKWFYAVTIATTTIGDFDAHPKTYTGKLLFIFVVLVGVVLVWSWMYVLGKMVAAAVRYLFSL